MAMQLDRGAREFERSLSQIRTFATLDQHGTPFFQFSIFNFQFSEAHLA
jgi:hypothetical protein